MKGGAKGVPVLASGSLDKVGKDQMPAPIESLLFDIRAMMLLPPGLYRPQVVANHMMALQNLCIDSGLEDLFHQVDSKARQSDKRPLISFIDGITAESIGKQRPENTQIRSLPGPPAPSVNYVAFPAPLSDHYGFPAATGSHANGFEVNGAFSVNGSHLTAPGAPTSTHNQPPNQEFSSFDPHFSGVLLPFDVGPLLASISASLPIAAGPDVTGRQSLLLDGCLSPALGGVTPSLRLVHEEVIRVRRGIHRCLYDDLGRQCKVCALRFPQTEEGSQQMQRHLDDHFRRNKRIKDKARKVVSRLWMQREADWASNVHKALEGEEPAALFGSAHEDLGHHGPLASAAPKAGLNVPVGGENGGESSGKTCAFCKEAIAVQWDQDLDEWVYPNVIQLGQDVSCILDVWLLILGYSLFIPCRSLARAHS